MCICPKFDITRSAMQDLARCRLVVPDMTWDKLKPDCYVVVEASSRFGHAIPGIFVYPNVYHDLDCAEAFVTFAMAWDFGGDIGDDYRALNGFLSAEKAARVVTRIILAPEPEQLRIVLEIAFPKQITR